MEPSGTAGTIPIAGAFSGGAGDDGMPAGMSAAQAFTPPAPSSTTASEATNWALDAAHDNLQPNALVASPLQRKWTATFDGPVEFPLVAHQRVYAYARDSGGGLLKLSALSVDTGTVIWGPVVIGGGSAGLVYDQEHLFAVDNNGNLSAIDASTGKQLWVTALTGQYDFTSGPVAAAGKVYVNGEGFGGTTFAVDGSSGKILWQKSTMDGSDGSVAVQGSRVYDAEACDQLYAFETGSGALDWYHQGTCVGGGGSTPSVYGNWIWEFDPGGSNIIIDAGGNLHGAFSADQPLSFDQGTVLYQKGQTLSAVDIATNVERWTFSPASMGGGNPNLCFGPVIAGKNHRIFIATDRVQLLELDEATGKLVSSDTLSADDFFGCAGTMAIAENQLFVPFADELFAY